MSSEIILASDRLSTSLAIEKGHMIATIKAQCFKGTSPDRISDTQLAAYIQVSQALMLQAPKFNPLLPGFLYAYPDKSGGITPIIGPDGVFALLASNPEIEGWTTKFETIDNELACIATIKHKRLGDISKTCFLSEWVVASNPNWQSRKRHMLEIRALKHAARQLTHGIPMDADEYELSKTNKGIEFATDVTGTGEPAAEEQKKNERPARKTGTKSVEQVAGEPGQTAEKVDATLAAPKRTEKPAEKVADKPADTKPAESKQAEQHEQTASAEADAAFAEEKAAPKVVVAQIKYPATLAGDFRLTKVGPNRNQKLIAQAQFKPDNADAEITCYSNDEKSPIFKLTVGGAVRAEVALESKNQTDPTKPAVIFINAFKALDEMPE